MFITKDALFRRTSRRVVFLAALLPPASACLAQPDVSMEEFTDTYCMECHNSEDWAAGVAFDLLPLSDVHSNRDLWEKVLLKLRVGMMPPAIAQEQLPMDERQAVISSLEEKLDDIVRDAPDPGPALIRRLNRAEYQNAIRDLLDLDVDAASLLPPDDSAYGFDNNAQALGVSPVLIEQYLSAAGKIAALAVGDLETGPSAQTFRIRQDASQNIPVLGMPVGTVGGGTLHTVMPLDGEYQLDVKLYKSNLGVMKGLELPHQLEIAVDGERVHLVTIGGEDDFKALMHNITEAAEAIEARSSIVLALPAGPHDISVGFVYEGAIQNSQRLQAFLRSSQDLLDVTGHPHLESLTVTGPYNVSGSGDTPSRRRIFSCLPQEQRAELGSGELECAREIISALARQAYRGTDTPNDVDVLMQFFALGRDHNGFEFGIQSAIERLLASPKFVFRAERDPANAPPGTVHPVSDHELASRLSFFLWSSIPDETLLQLADSGRLSDPGILDQQVKRMLVDPKARALVDNFAGQWLYLRNLDSIVPNSSGFPDFDDNLRQAMRTETELFFESVVREDRSIVDLMNADYTYLNERLARHYGIKGVYGNHFRRVSLEDESRWGLLGKGSVLMISSHTDRTSPIVRGQWVLTNILGAPAPAPPPNIPPLPEPSDAEGLVQTLRQRMEMHRNNPACSSCHEMMEPIGYSMEYFDAIGAWREREHGIESPLIDATGRLLDGTFVEGPAQLRKALMRQPEIFVTTATEKLMVYALGRGMVPADMPAIRRIIRDSREKDYRFSSLIAGIVHSVPFQMRVSSSAVDALAARGNE
ncbi:MAG TPA: DUF1592 domain-containing protein [Hyphomicrobiales bacterium]|nr:DUF1592 domain-containing protein [Hyphomicrobiales bacterium]